MVKYSKQGELPCEYLKAVPTTLLFLPLVRGVGVDGGGRCKPLS